MNCTNHPDASVVAYCRTCGKPLCEKCTRDVRGVIYCENCLAERLQGVQPPPPFSGGQAWAAYDRQWVGQQGTGSTVPPPAVGFVPPAVPYTPSTGPNPTVAGILGAIPFGVGAVYNGQYTKGLVHLGIFVLLIVLQSSDVPWFLHMFLGMATAFFVVYQIVDAVRSARAIQVGQPAPDPFGLRQAFSPGEKIDTSKIPVGAVVLIGLGLVFLLHVDLGQMWSLILIALGVWLGASRMGLLGGNVQINSKTMMAPAVLLTLGGLFLLEQMHGPGFGHTWPILLLVIGAVKLMGGDIGTSAGIPMPPVPPQPPASDTGGAEVPPPTGEVQPPSAEVKKDV